MIDVFKKILTELVVNAKQVEVDDVDTYWEINVSDEKMRDIEKELNS